MLIRRIGFDTQSMENSIVTKKALTPAKLSALKYMLKNGAFSVYIHHGFTGFAKPRYQFYDAPPNFNAGTLKWMQEREFVYLIIKDDFREVWGISKTGLKALQASDQTYAKIDSRFTHRKIQHSKQSYILDNVGLITENPIQPEGKGRVYTMKEKDNQNTCSVCDSILDNNKCEYCTKYNIEEPKNMMQAMKIKLEKKLRELGITVTDNTQFKDSSEIETMTVTFPPTSRTKK